MGRMLAYARVKKYSTSREISQKIYTNISKGEEINFMWNFERETAEDIISKNQLLLQSAADSIS